MGPELLPSSPVAARRWALTHSIPLRRALGNDNPAGKHHNGPKKDEKLSPGMCGWVAEGCWRQTRSWGLHYVPWTRARSSHLTRLAGKPQHNKAACWNEVVVVQLQLNTTQSQVHGGQAPCTDPWTQPWWLHCASVLVLLLEKVLHHTRISASAFWGFLESSPLGKLLAVVWALDYALGPNMQVCHMGNSHWME